MPRATTTRRRPADRPTPPRTAARTPASRAATTESAYRSEDFATAAELGLSLPALVLAIRVDPSQRDQPVYHFKPGRAWTNLAVPVGGKTARYLATFIQPTAAAAYEITTLVKRWPTVIARPQGGPSLAAINDYSEYLRDHLRCTCEACYQTLATGHFPIDVECLRLLTDERIPASGPDDLIEWTTGWQRAAGAANRWSLVILGAAAREGRD